MVVRGVEGSGGGREGQGGSVCSPTSLGIDHVTAPAITSDMPLCYYCTVMPNKMVSL